MRAEEIRFVDCTVDRARRVVVRRGKPVALSPMAFQLLEILLDESPRIVPKRELAARLWPRTVVGEANLSNLVGKVRAAIGDSSRPARWLTTVHAYGYGIDGIDSYGDATGIEPPLSSWLVHPGGRAALPEGIHLIGRHPRSVVPLDSPVVSRRHARITISACQATLADLGSRNGTYVGRSLVRTPITLSDGDSIRLGDVVLEYQLRDLRHPTDELAPLREPSFGGDRGGSGGDAGRFERGRS